MISHQPHRKKFQTGSRNALKSMSGPDFLGGSRGRMKQTHSMSVPRLRNASTLVVQANPS